MDGATVENEGRLAGIWRRLYGYFLPAGFSQEREACNRARMFLISHLFGPILGNTVPAALWAANPAPGWDILVLAGSISLFWVFPFLLRWGVAYERLVYLSVINLNFCILFSCYHYGGVASPTLSWVLTIPILSLFYVGGDRRLQVPLLGIGAVAFVLFFLAYILVPPPPKELREGATLALGAISTVATLCYVATMAIYYARIFDAGVDLEIEVKRRRQMAEELRRAIVETDRAGSARAEFLARMSHEIRTPINAIIGYAQLLLEEAEAEGDEQMREDIGRILDAGRYLVRLIDMILDLAKMDAGRMSFDVRPHSLRDFVTAAVEARRPVIEAGGNAVVVEIEPGLGEGSFDRNRLLQILDALLENAARHTHNGRITVALRRAGFGSGDAFALSVADDGAGIPADALASIFDTFATSRSAADGRYGGTGLNLAVCRQLCRAMGGSISGRSRLGEGSTFTILLPLDPATRSDAPLAQEPDAFAA